MSIRDELTADSQRLRSVQFILNGKATESYFKVMLGSDHSKIMDRSKKSRTIKQTDGSTIESEYYDDDLIRAYTIYFQMRDIDSEWVFTDFAKDPKWIQENVAYETQCVLAASMGLRSVSDMIEEAKKNYLETVQKDSKQP